MRSETAHFFASFTIGFERWIGHLFCCELVAFVCITTVRDKCLFVCVSTMVRFSLRSKSKDDRKVNSASDQHSFHCTQKGLVATLMEPTSVETEFFPRILRKKLPAPQGVDLNSSLVSLDTAGNTTLLLDEEGQEDVEAIYDNEHVSFEFSEAEDGTLNTASTDGTSIFPECNTTAASYLNPTSNEGSIFPAEYTKTVAAYLGFATGCSPEDDGEEQSIKGKDTISLMTGDQQSGDNTEETDDDIGTCKTAYMSRLLAVIDSHQDESQAGSRFGFDSWGHAPTRSQHSSSRIDRVLSETDSCGDLAEEISVKDSETVSTLTTIPKPEELENGPTSLPDKIVDQSTILPQQGNSQSQDNKTKVVTRSEIDEIVKRLEDKAEDDDNTDMGSGLKVYGPRTPTREAAPRKEKIKRKGFFGRLRGSLSGSSRRQASATKAAESSTGASPSVWSKISGTSPPSSPRSSRMASPTHSLTSSPAGVRQMSSKPPRSPDIQRIDPLVEPASENEREPNFENNLDSLELPSLTDPTNSFMQFIASQSNIFGLTMLPEEQDTKTEAGSISVVERSQANAMADNPNTADPPDIEHDKEDSTKGTSLEPADEQETTVLLSCFPKYSELEDTPKKSAVTENSPYKSSNSILEESSQRDQDTPSFDKPLKVDEDDSAIQTKQGQAKNETLSSNTTVKPKSTSEDQLADDSTTTVNKKKDPTPALQFNNKNDTCKGSVVKVSEQKSTKPPKASRTPKHNLRNRFMANNSKMKGSRSNVEWVYKSPAQPSPEEPTIETKTKTELVPKPRSRSKINDNKSVGTRGTFKTHGTSASKAMQSTLSFDSDRSSVLFQAHHCWQPVPSTEPPRSIVTKRKGAKKSPKTVDPDTSITIDSSDVSATSEQMLESGHCGSILFPERKPKSKIKMPLPLPTKREPMDNGSVVDYEENLALARADPTLTKTYNEQTLMATLTKEDTTLGSIHRQGGGCCAYAIDEDDDLDYPPMRRLHGIGSDSSSDSDDDSSNENMAGKTLSLSRNEALADDITEISLLSKSTMGQTTVDGSKGIDSRLLLNSTSSQSTNLRQRSTVSSAFVKLEDTRRMDSIAEEDPEGARVISVDPLFRLLGAASKKTGREKRFKKTSNETREQLKTQDSSKRDGFDALF